VTQELHGQHVHSMISWELCKQDFDSDGGTFRDIYIFKTTLPDWQLLFDFLRTPYKLKFLVDGEPQMLPRTVDELFVVRQQSAPSLNFYLGDIFVACYSFTVEEIEFVIDAREIACQSDLDLVLGFMRKVGDALHKPTVLTPENLPTSPIIIYEPETGTFTHHKAPT